MTTIRAHFDGKVFVPDEPVAVPEGQPVTLHVEVEPPTKKYMTGQDLLDSGLVGLWRDREDIGDSLEFARELRRRAERREDR